MILCWLFNLPMFFFPCSDAVEMACHAPLFVNDDIEKKLVLMALYMLSLLFPFVLVDLEFSNCV
jgi:hypothetical protein